MLQASERSRPLGSRIHGCRRILAELVRLSGKVEKAATGRLMSDVELQWLGNAADALDRLIAAGNSVLPGYPDPTTHRKARKRPGLDGYHEQDRWQVGVYEA